MRCFCSRNFIFALAHSVPSALGSVVSCVIVVVAFAVGGLIAGFASVLGVKAEDVASQLPTDCPEASGQAAGVSVYFA